MYTWHREFMTDEDRSRFSAMRKASLLSKLKRLFIASKDDGNVGSVDVYEIFVEECSIFRDFSDELPLYILDIGDRYVILFGQWLYDPFVIEVGDEVFDGWDSAGSFFETFTIRFLTESGQVLRLTPKGAVFSPTKKLSFPVKFKRLGECQVMDKKDSDILKSLRAADLIF